MQNGVLFIDNANSDKGTRWMRRGSSSASTRRHPGSRHQRHDTLDDSNRRSEGDPRSDAGTDPKPTSGAAPSTSGAGSGAGQTVAATAPAAPGDPTATAGDDSASVSWVSPDPHGSPITSSRSRRRHRVRIALG